MADIFASTTGTDADWIVKLIDVAPDGQQTMIVDEIFRGRYRKSFEKPEPIEPNKVEEYKWSLHGADHTFLKGHRIRLEVSSSNYPRFDRNLNSAEPLTTGHDPRVAENHVLHNTAHPSALILPIVPAD